MHDCFDCDKTFENNKQMKVYLLVIHCDLDLVHDHKHSCGEPFNCERFECGKVFGSKHTAMDQKRSCWSFDCFYLESTFPSKKDINCNMKSNHPHPWTA